jgi:hypothetical protein
MSHSGNEFKLFLFIYAVALIHKRLTSAINAVVWKLITTSKNFSLIRLVGGGVQLGPLGTAATDWLIVACPGIMMMENLVELRFAGETEVLEGKPVPAPLCPPQIPLDQTRDRTRAAAVGSQRLNA